MSTVEVWLFSLSDTAERETETFKCPFLFSLFQSQRQAYACDPLQGGGEPFQALYNYMPRNEDELELKEGDVVDVMEKCDDGWFVGTSRRTKFFGTFPGNYVKRL